MMSAYPWDGAVGAGGSGAGARSGSAGAAAGDSGGGSAVSTLFWRLQRDGAIDLNWATKDLPADESVPGDRPAEATRGGLHTVVRTLTYHTAARYEPRSGSFTVNLGRPPHMLRDMPGLVPRERLDAGGDPGFCNVADTAHAADTACRCTAIVEGVTVESARAQIYVGTRKKADRFADWVAEYNATAALFERILSSGLVAPTVSIVRSRAGGSREPRRVHDLVLAPVAAPAVRCDVLRAAWFGARHSAAYRCDSKSAGAHSRIFPDARVCEPASVAPEYVAQADEEILPYRDTGTTLASLRGGARTTIFRLPYALHEPLAALARMTPNERFLQQIGASSCRVACLRLACAILAHRSVLAADRHEDAVPLAEPQVLAAALGRLGEEGVRHAVLNGPAPVTFADPPVSVVDEFARAPVSAAQQWRRGAANAPAPDAPIFADETARARLSALLHYRREVVDAARDLRDAVYPVWDAARGHELQLRWHVSSADAGALFGTGAAAAADDAPQAAGCGGGDRAIQTFISATVRVRVRFVHCSQPA